MSRGLMSDWEHVVILAEDTPDIRHAVAWCESRPDVQQALDAAYALGGWEAGIAVWRGYDAEWSAQEREP